MGRTIKFILIVTVASGVFSFIIAALLAGAARPAPTYLGVVFGMVAGIVYLLLSGNKKIPLADDAARRAVLDGRPPGDAARLLVVRQSKTGMMVGVDILVDGVTATQLKSPRFAALTLAPGRHEVIAVTQGKRTAPVSVDLASGATAVLRVTTGFGGVKLAPEADGAQLRAALMRVPMVA